tara:strand:- start:222 stop:602 length:381 start_codon:yes stop_codon:yes gene_type:complete
MAQTIPIYINVDTITSATLADGTETAEAAIEVNAGEITAGLLWGVHGGPITNDPGGQVIVRVWNDDASTRELYSVTLDFSGGTTQASDLMSAAVPFFEAAYFTAEGDSANAGETIDLTFYVQALRY